MVGAGKPQAVTRGRGRPRLGVYRLETTISAEALAELKRREQQTGVYRTRIAATLLTDALIGGEVHSFNSPRA